MLDAVLYGSNVLAEYLPLRCAVLCCALVSTAAHLLFIFSRPSSALPSQTKCCKHPFPVITRGPPARLAYLGKLAHRRGAIRRHDSWLASRGNKSSYSRAVSQPVNILVRNNLEMDYAAQLPLLFLSLRSSTHFIHYLSQIRKSLWLFFSICSVPCLLWGIMEGPKLLGLVL